VRVRCIKDELTEEEVARVGFPAGRWGVTVGKEYLVLGVAFPLANVPGPRGVD